MKHTKYIIFLLLFIIGGIGFANAQSAPADNTPTVFELPQVSVVDLQVGAQNGNQVRGTFKMRNDSVDILGDLNYQISLLGKQEKITKSNKLFFDNALVYDKSYVEKKISLNPQEAKNVEFSHQYPTVPEGDYRLRVRVTTSKGEELGWGDTDIKIAANTGSFAKLTLGPVVSDTGKKFSQPMDGVNVAPGSDVELSYYVENSTKKALQGTVVLDIYEFDLAGKKVSSLKGDALEVLAGKTINKTFAIKAETIPTAYQGMLYLVDNTGQKISNTNEYRWVVTGKGARILFSRINELSDSLAKVQVEVVGPADRTSVEKARINLQLFDGATEIKKMTGDLLELDQRGSLSYFFEIPLTAHLANPSVKAVLVEENGTVLDSYDVTYEGKTASTTTIVKPISTDTQKNQTKQLLATVVIIAIALIGIAVTIFLLFLRRHGSKEQYIKIFSIAALLAISAVLLISRAPKTDAVTFGAKDYWWYAHYNVWMYVNNPVHNQNYDMKNVPLQADFHWAHCYNAIGSSEAAVKFLTDGQKRPINSLTDQGPWRTLIQQNMNSGVINKYICGANIIDHRWHIERCDGVLNANLDLSPFNYPSTTLAIMIKAINDFRDAYGVGVATIGDYRYLNFLPSVDLKVNGSDGPLTLTPTGSTISVTPSWISATNASSCTASSSPTSAWTGNKNITGGTESINLNANTNYTLTLTCVGPTGLTNHDDVVVNISAPPNQLPIGSVDGVDANDNVYGWACDADDFSQALAIHFYTNGLFTGGVWANILSDQGVINACGGVNAAHKFSFPVPSALKDGSVHNIIAFALNTPAGPNPIIGNTNYQYLAPPPTPPPSTLSCSASPTSIYTGSEVTFTVNGASAGSTYTWDPLTSGATLVSGYSFNSNPLKVKFSTSGSKTITASSSGTVSCSMSVNISNRQTPGDIKEL